MPRGDLGDVTPTQGGLTGWILPVPETFFGRIAWLERLRVATGITLQIQRMATHDLLMLQWIRMKKDEIDRVEDSLGVGCLDTEKDADEMITEHDLADGLGEAGAQYMGWLDRRFKDWETWATMITGGRRKVRVPVPVLVSEEDERLLEKWCKERAGDTMEWVRGQQGMSLIKDS
jgi:hypothetical protein